MVATNLVGLGHQRKYRVIFRRVFAVALLVAFSLQSPCLLAADTNREFAAGDTSTAMKWLASQFQEVKQNNQREQLVVWLFDESLSVRDSLAAVALHFHDAYGKADRGRTTVIHGFGRGVSQLMRQPVPETPRGINEIRQAIDHIPIDESGDENMCGAIESVVAKWTDLYPQRQVVVVVVTDEETSDASGLGETDSQTSALEEAVELCRRTGTVVFVLGWEAVFGTNAGRIAWKDPVYGLNHWLPVRKGPDSPFPERLQWTGLRKVADAVPCAFGPYSQERLCRETGGGFFLVTDAVDRVRQRRQAMAGYEPDWRSRREYKDDLGGRPLRQACHSVIRSLDLFADDELNPRKGDFSVEQDEFDLQRKENFVKAIDALRAVNDCVKKLESVEHLRETETSKRWQANFDVLYAQVLASQARLPQYIAALNTHGSTRPRPLQPKHNRWMAITSKKPPAVLTDEQFRPIQLSLELSLQRDAYFAQLTKAREKAMTLLQQIEEDHPGTPWAEIARQERSRGFNVEFRSYFLDPKYEKISKRIRHPRF
jgi:hypothetical protein